MTTRFMLFSSCRNGPLSRKDAQPSTVLIRPDCWRQVYWTKVSIDTLVSALYVSRAPSTHGGIFCNIGGQLLGLTIQVSEGVIGRRYRSSVPYRLAQTQSSKPADDSKICLLDRNTIVQLSFAPVSDPISSSSRRRAGSGFRKPSSKMPFILASVPFAASVLVRHTRLVTAGALMTLTMQRPRWDEATG